MKSDNGSSAQLLRRLARFHGIQTSYKNAKGEIRDASEETLRRLLLALGVELGAQRTLREVWERSRQEHWEQPIEPVAVLWDERPGKIEIRVPAGRGEDRIGCCLVLEDGTDRRWTENLARASTVESVTLSQGAFVKKQLSLPGLEMGFHRFNVEIAGTRHEALLISAPLRCYEEQGARRTWGVFLPMYACHSKNSWGAGNLSDWAELCQWVGSLGAAIAGTLPLMPAFLENSFEPSPYSPVSRLFWNEFYIDVTKSPELAGCGAARRMLENSDFPKEFKALSKKRLVEYGREMCLKRQVLEKLAPCLLESKSERRSQFAEFVSQRPDLRRYAEFRAVAEKAGRNWHTWPERLHRGEFKPGDYQVEAKEYHLYVQWLAQEQVDKLLSVCHQAGVRFYLDLPLGVNRDGYDAWRFRDSFVEAVSVGAPPDTFFTKGQDWGFPPLHPQRARYKMYDYLLQVLRFQMGNTGLLRLDHVMGLHRLYWVPRGMAASEGAYVSYPAEELYALLSVESHRNKTALVGENLGTVPEKVNRNMARHGLRKMFVLQYELQPRSEPLRPPQPETLACLNTHDMPQFAAFWKGLDISDRAKLGLIAQGKLGAERQQREKVKRALAGFLQRKGLLGRSNPGPAEILKAALGFLASSPTEMLLVNLEDLWLETRPQNVPGTSRERPNWRRKARLDLEEITSSPELAEILAWVNKLRKGMPGATTLSVRKEKNAWKS